MAKISRVPTQPGSQTPRPRVGMLTTIKQADNLHSTTVPEDESPKIVQRPRLGMLTIAGQSSTCTSGVVEYDQYNSMHLKIPSRPTPQTPLSQPYSNPERVSERPYRLNDSSIPLCTLCPRTAAASDSDAEAENCTDTPERPIPPKSHGVKEIANTTAPRSPKPAGQSATVTAGRDLLSEPQIKCYPIIGKRRMSEAEFISAGVAQITALHLRRSPAPAPRSWAGSLELLGAK